MPINTPINTIIKQIESEFDDIYRITTENGLILDISENKKPDIGSRIEYYINDTPKNLDNNYVIMNGIFFETNSIGIIVSFGGLLGNIPMTETAKNNISNHSNVCLIYKLIS